MTTVCIIIATEKKIHSMKDSQQQQQQHQIVDMDKTNTRHFVVVESPPMQLHSELSAGNVISQTGP
jgi:hypothetical protein